MGTGITEQPSWPSGPWVEFERARPGDPRRDGGAGEPGGEPDVRILLVDDDASFREDLTALMRRRYRIVTAATPAEALDAVARFSFDAVLLDIDLGRGTDGFEILKRLRQTEPELPVIMVTRDTSAASAVAALKLGAADYIDKQPDLADLERRIARALDERRLREENRFLRRELHAQVGRMVGEGPAMHALRREMETASQGSSPILIVGETGTGKELVARGIHGRACPQAPFVAVNCAAVPKDLFESQLFGSERGAFTGAERRIVGCFELSGEGVLFLDEITEIDSGLQAKLLRAIEQREFQRLGSSRTLKFRGRVLASSNRDLEESVRGGALRPDLYYRLSTYIIRAPALREHPEDIPLLAKHFVERKAVELKKPCPELTADLLASLCGYGWPGNVRELQNTIEALVVRGCLTLPGGLAGADGLQAGENVFGLSYDEAKEIVLNRFQVEFVRRSLAATGGDVGLTARQVGLSRPGLLKLMRRLGLGTSA